MISATSTPNVSRPRTNESSMIPEQKNVKNCSTEPDRNTWSSRNSMNAAAIAGHDEIKEMKEPSGQCQRSAATVSEQNQAADYERGQYQQRDDGDGPLPKRLLEYRVSGPYGEIVDQGRWYQPAG